MARDTDDGVIGVRGMFRMTRRAGFSGDQADLDCAKSQSRAPSIK